MSSILNDTKKILGIDSTYDVFDQDIITFINAAFSVVNQLGVGPDAGFYVTDTTDEWVDIGVSDKLEKLLQTYVYLRVRMLFDPPSMSFLVDSMNNQLKEYEWRLIVFREAELLA